MHALVGKALPCDSGGLIKNIKPVCKRARDDRNKYLRDHSWPTAPLNTLLAAYPGGDLVNYVAMKKPKHEGPHVVLPVPSGAAKETIWKDNNDWRSWTWEGRSPRRLLTGKHLYRWTCPTNVYPKILAYIAGRSAAERSWFKKVQQLYVRGGLATLLTSLRAEQETP
jgi:hypothetical protein